MTTQAKPTPGAVALATATDQATSNAGPNTSATAAVSITNTVVAAGADGKVQKTIVKDTASVTLCNETGTPQEATGGCSC